MSRLRTWLRTWWLDVPEPREISLGWGALYVSTGAIGIATLTAPGSTAWNVLGLVGVLAIGLLLLVGTIFACVGGAREHWKLERVGVAGVILGLLIYGGMLWALFQTPIAATWQHPDFTAAAAQGPQLGILGALVLALCLRYMMIRRFEYRPRG